MATTIRTLARTLKNRHKLPMSSLDCVLDVKPSDFPKIARRLIDLLDRLDVAVTYDAPKACDDEGEPAEVMANSDVGGRDLRSGMLANYQHDVARLPRLTRVGEFMMARRYSFLKMRAVKALCEGGLLEQTALNLVKGKLEDHDLNQFEGMSPARARRARMRFAQFEELRNRFIEGALYIVLKGVHRYSGLGIDTPDLIQEGNASLFQAVDGFDWTRDVRFKTYAEYWINQAFLKMLYNNTRTVRVPVWVQKALRKINNLRAQALQNDGVELTDAQIGQALGMPAERVTELRNTHRYAVSLDAELPGDDGGRMGDLVADQRVPEVTEVAQDVSLRDRLAQALDDLPDRERLILRMRFGLDGTEPSTLSEVGQVLSVSAERVRQLQEVALRRLKAPRKMKLLEAFAGQP